MTPKELPKSSQEFFFSVTEVEGTPQLSLAVQQGKRIVLVRGKPICRVSQNRFWTSFCDAELNKEKPFLWGGLRFVCDISIRFSNETTFRCCWYLLVLWASDVFYRKDGYFVGTCENPTWKQCTAARAGVCGKRQGRAEGMWAKAQPPVWKPLVLGLSRGC